MDEPVDPQVARERLDREQVRVEHLIAELREEGLDETAADRAGDLARVSQHPADRGSDTFEREKDLAILESLEAELAEIEAALQRIDEGTYGVDENTGAPIDPERLAAQPTARTNLDGPPGS